LVPKLVKAIGKNLVAHFVGAHGTPVEKHWAIDRDQKICSFITNFIYKDQG